MEIATVPKARGAKNWWLLVVAKVKIGDLSQEKWWVYGGFIRETSPSNMDDVGVTRFQEMLEMPIFS